MKDQLIKDITAACVLVNPEIVGNRACLACQRQGKIEGHCLDRGHPLQLADVLLAIKQRKSEYSYFIDTDGNFHEWFALKGRLDLRTVAKWKLPLPLHDQDIPTLEFIHSLICV